MPLLAALPVVPDLWHNELVHLQLAIARRADRLARCVISDPVTDLELWKQAEAEVFARHQPGHENVTAR